MLSPSVSNQLTVGSDTDGNRKEVQLGLESEISLVWVYSAPQQGC